MIPGTSLASPTSDSPKSLFSELRHLAAEKGLFERQPIPHFLKIGFNIVMLAGSISLLLLAPVLWLQLINAAFMGFVFTQIAFIAHDTGHRQNLRNKKLNDFLGMLHGNLLLGMSYAWWVKKHDAHHSNPNQLNHDPDVEILFLAFDEEQVKDKRGIARFFVKYQAFFFFPLLLFQSFSLRYGSIDWLVRRKFKHRLSEAALILAHFAWFLTLIFYCLPGWPGVAFLAIHQGIMGLYLGSVFAPNHKGMPVLESDCELDYLHQQVLTARNVKGHPLTDFWYGGLNYQIEHHLFPNMPRNLLRKAQPLVRDFCRRHGIPYHETSMLRSYREILQHLHAISAPLRRRVRLTTAS